MLIIGSSMVLLSGQYHLPLPTLSGYGLVRLPAAVNGVARVGEALAVLELVSALGLFPLLKNQNGLPGLLREASAISKEGPRWATNSTFLLFETGMQGRPAGQNLRDKSAEALVAELLAIGHNYASEMVWSDTLGEAGWLRKDPRAENAQLTQLLGRAIKGIEIKDEQIEEL